MNQFDIERIELVAKLNSEVSQGRSASAAYFGYLNDFIETQQRTNYEQFLSADSDEAALFIRQYSIAITALETAIQSDITTGKLAAQQLEAMNK